MIVCNLTKPESTLDQVRKAYPKLLQTDAAQLAVALFLSGKYARATYDGEEFTYPIDVARLTKAISVELNQIQIAEEPTKKMTKAAAAAFEEEAVELRVGLLCSIEEGEKALGERNDLKTLLSDTIRGGVEFQFGPTDVLWQWALDRANWNTVSSGELTRRVKLRTEFQDNSVGTDLGSGGGKRKTTRAPKVTKKEEVKADEPVATVDTEEAIPE